jgi:hypothetical protein
MNPTPKQMSRLPVWAQDHIALLEMRAAEASKRASIGWQDERTSACIERTIFDAHPFRHEYLDIGNKHVLISEIEVSLRDGECNVTTTGGKLLVIEPVCGNVVTIKVVPK